MLTKYEFHERIAAGLYLMDGATGSNLRLLGMPKGCSTEKWVLEHPDVLQNLQRQYAEAGSQILYAPTLQAQPIALKAVGLDTETEKINARLVALAKAAAPGCLVAGDITTLAAFCDSWYPRNFDLLVENYRRQIRGLIDGGVDFLGAETLLYPQEAEAILAAAELEGAGAVTYTFTMQSDGCLFSGTEAGPILKELERSGAAAVGCCCQMVGFAVSSFRENGVSGLIAQGLGTSMLQVGNILRSPAILVPPTLASAILGPFATTVFQMRNTGSAAGMGTSGLVGQFGTWSVMSAEGGALVKIILLHFVLPAALSLLISEIMRRRNWIKPGAMKLEL